MTWFKKLTGIDEKSPDQVRRELPLEDDCIISPMGERLAFGRLETPKLSELRRAVAELDIEPGPSSIGEIVADVRELHADPANADALFQVASQFNLLEMTGPTVTSERGVGIYENDPTQGPACAIACGAGTIYRNYFADVDGQIGQTADKQIDCAADLEAELGNTHQRLWKMRNGYLFPSNEGLAEITDAIRLADETARYELLGHLRVGLQHDAEFTIGDWQLSLTETETCNRSAMLRMQICLVGLVPWIGWHPILLGGKRMHHACLETGTGEGTFRREVVVLGSFNDDNRVLDLMLLLSLANEHDGSLEMSRLMFKRSRFDEQLPEVIGHHPFRAILSWIDTNDCKSFTTDLGNAIRDGTTWLLQMLSVLGTRLCIGTTSATAEFTGRDTLQIEE